MRPVALVAGIVVGSACLVYLTLWWNVTNASAGMSATTLVALLVAVVISVMLGHVTTTTALALMAFELDDRLPTTPRIASWRSSVALAVVGVVAASLVVVVATRTGRREREASVPTLTVVPTGARVVVIGIDGFDPAFARTLVHDGDLPALARVLASPHLDIPRGDGTDPVPLWASIATGQPPARHGALGLEARRVAGLEGQLPVTGSRLSQAISGATDLLRLTRPAISSGLERRAPAFWEVASRAGLRTAVVNWWTTWPARVEDGTVISDRAIVRLERGGNSDGEVVPVAAYTALRQSWTAIRADADARARRLASPVPAGLMSDAARDAIALDGMLSSFARVLPVEQLDLLTLYLPGLDIAQSRLFAARDGMSPADLAVAVRAVTAVYTSLDDIVSRFTGDDVILVVVGHPGRAVPQRAAWLSILSARGKADSPGNDTVAGDDLRPPTAAASLEDVAPTVLALLGVPVADDIAGHPRFDLVAPAFAAAHPVRRVPTWGMRLTDVRRPADSRIDDEARERLRSLGYVR